MEKTPNFKEFRLSGARMGSNYVGITTNGFISIYSGLFINKDLQRFKKCVILYDKEQRLLGLRFGNDELGTGSFPVNKVERGTAAISAQNFFKKNPELKLNEISGRYEPEKYDNGTDQEIYMIDLDKKV